MQNGNPVIEEALRNLKIESLNTMQQAMLQADGDNLILLSPTGSGKTLAYLLPLLLSLKTDIPSVQAMIITPSRELALQIDSVFKAMNTLWKTCCCYGGHPISEEKKCLLHNHPAVLIGTPGRIADHLRKENFHTSTITTLILDEFDKSLELGFQEQMEEIISVLANLEKRILISATDMEVIPDFTGLTHPLKLNFLATDTYQSKIELFKVISPEKDKIEVLYKLLCTLGNKSSIVFCNYRESVERVHQLLNKEGLYSELFHGGMEQPDRERALYKFRNGSCNVLIATDLAARGLDIPEVEHIIHYQFPINEEAYTHRNGRTARWDAKGNSYLIINNTEKIPEYLPVDTLPQFILPARIPRPAKPQWVTLYIGKGKKDKVNRIDIAGFLYKKGNLTREDVGQIDVKENYAFVAIRQTKVKQLMTLIRGEKIKGMKTVIEEAH